MSNALHHADALSDFRLDAAPMPDAAGRFGDYGGSWIPELLVPAVTRIADAWSAARVDPAFGAEYAHLCRSFIGRPTPLQDAPRLAAHAGGACILLKREDLAHTGAHKINNAIGQALLARQLGARRVIAETGAGQHGVATATACALLGIECVVYMGAHDIERQNPNVLRMDLLGAEVRAVEEGQGTLTDAVSAAIRDWVVDPEGTYYLLGSAVGMHPFPTMVRDLQSVIGHEARHQALDQLGQLPDAVVACVGGGSNAIGTFRPFVDDSSVELHGAEAAGDGVDTPRHAASIVAGSDGVLHGARTRLLQDDDGQVLTTHSISAGLDYPGVGPEHAQLAATGRATYHPVTDDEAMSALDLLCRTEGIIPAIESAHAVALGVRIAATRSADEVIVITVSGRGDKDLATIAEYRRARGASDGSV
ncbi:MAG: tryptophan synthase, beta subunit [Thermoleophilia bacterium]|jgi:tryptophan synthase beta chain|nr:tryptophan synthase, beta subunit [Thermoleophilia bacterium]